MFPCWAQFGLTFHLGSRKPMKANSVWLGVLEITAEIKFTELRAGPREGMTEGKVC